MVRTRETSPSYQHTPSLLDLNDDCLILILCKLNLLQQYQLSQLDERFNDIVQRLWRKRSRDLAIHPEHIQNINDAEFIAFISAICEHMDSLCIRYLDVEKLRLLRDCTFEKTYTFDYAALERNAEDVYEIVPEEKFFLDEDILMLQRIFPNLRILKLRSCQITGKYLSDFSSLQQLKLADCHCLKSAEFREIFQRLKLQKFDVMENCEELKCWDLRDLVKCPTLEHIKISNKHLCFNINNILRMPRFRKFTIYAKDFDIYIVDRIPRHLIKPIEAFKFNGILQSFERFLNKIPFMKELQKVAFYYSRRYDIELIRNHMLQQAAEQLSELRQIHLCSCELESESGLLHFVRNCQQLRLIDITNTHKITESFVWSCIEILQKQKWRLQPLELWIKHTDIKCSILEDPRYVANKRLLKINTKKWTDNTNPPGVLKFTWQF